MRATGGLTMTGRFDDEEVGSASPEADEYAELLQRHYARLARKQQHQAQPTMGLQEVKLRLFLSLLRGPDQSGLSSRPDSARQC